MLIQDTDGTLTGRVPLATLDRRSETASLGAAKSGVMFGQSTANKEVSNELQEQEGIAMGARMLLGALLALLLGTRTLLGAKEVFNDMLST